MRLSLGNLFYSLRRNNSQSTQSSNPGSCYSLQDLIPSNRSTVAVVFPAENTPPLTHTSTSLSDTIEYIKRESASGQKFIFLSYRWGYDAENLSNLIKKCFEQERLNLLVDKFCFGLRDSIDEYMRLICNPSVFRALIIINDNKGSNCYFFSRNCMYELHLALSYPELAKRNVIVIFLNTSISSKCNPGYIKSVQDFWQQRANDKSMSSEEALLALKFQDTINTFYQLVTKKQLTVVTVDQNTSIKKITQLSQELSRKAWFWRDIKPPELDLDHAKTPTISDDTFIGREKDSSILLQKLVPGMPIVVYGSSGIGKKKFVKHVLLNGYERILQVFTYGVFIYQICSNDTNKIMQEVLQEIIRTESMDAVATSVKVRRSQLSFTGAKKYTIRDNYNALFSKGIILIFTVAKDLRLDTGEMWNQILGGVKGSNSCVIIIVDDFPTELSNLVSDPIKLSPLAKDRQLILLKKNLTGYKTVPSDEQLNRLLDSVNGNTESIIKVAQKLVSTGQSIEDYLTNGPVAYYYRHSRIFSQKLAIDSLACQAYKDHTVALSNSTKNIDDLFEQAKSILKLEGVASGKKIVHISYYWSEENHQRFIELQEELICHTIEVLPHSMNFVVQGKGDAYAKIVCKADCVIILLDSNYLKSRYCMYEVLQFNNDKIIIINTETRLFGLYQQLETEFSKYWLDERDRFDYQGNFSEANLADQINLKIPRFLRNTVGLRLWMTYTDCIQKVYFDVLLDRITKMSKYIFSEESVNLQSSESIPQVSDVPSFVPSFEQHINSLCANNQHEDALTTCDYRLKFILSHTEVDQNQVAELNKFKADIYLAQGKYSDAFTFYNEALLCYQSLNIFSGEQVEYICGQIKLVIDNCRNNNDFKTLMTISSNLELLNVLFDICNKLSIN